MLLALGSLASVPDAKAQQWQGAFRLGGAGAETIAALAPAPGGDLYVAGRMLGTTRLRRWLFGGGRLSHEPGGFVARVSAGGWVRWATPLGADVRALAVDPDGALYAGGLATEGAVGPTLTHAPGTSFVDQQRGQVGFVARLSARGDAEWAVRTRATPAAAPSRPSRPTRRAASGQAEA